MGLMGDGVGERMLEVMVAESVRRREKKRIEGVETSVVPISGFLGRRLLDLGWLKKPSENNFFW